MNPEVQWLTSKWGLPDAAVSDVEELIKAEQAGSTAIKLETDVDFGEAVQGGSSPLVCIENGGARYLQSRRLHRAEQFIAERLMLLAANDVKITPTTSVGDLFSSAENQEDRQKQAAEKALRKRLVVITGGPGTGKTYTIARILALMLEGGIQPEDIRLAAPTGKAADRMKHAVAESCETLPESFKKHREGLERAAQTSCTLHSLLKYNPRMRACAYNEDRHLPCKAVVVDECSMIDVHLWKALLAALPDDAHLILVGDPDQLESVGAGNVLKEIVTAAAQCQVLNEAVVELIEARRFKDRPDIAALASGVRRCEVKGVTALLERNKGGEGKDGVAWIEATATSLTIENFPSAIKESLIEIAKEARVEEALQKLARVCVLAPHRRFSMGVRVIGERIEQWLQEQGEIRNRPVIIDVNDPETGLRNGTVGIIRQDETEGRKFYYIAANGEMRKIAAVQIPEHSSAWAITIHRSQGSEYDDILVISPDKKSDLVTREMIYTAITRAKKNVYIAGKLEVIEAAVTSSGRRVTLLASAFERAEKKLST